jgi:hypothetical protein
MLRVSTTEETIPKVIHAATHTAISNQAFKLKSGTGILSMLLTLADPTNQRRAVISMKSPNPPVRRTPILIFFSFIIISPLYKRYRSNAPFLKQTLQDIVLLFHHRWRKIAPRSHHPKGDLLLQGEIKKNSPKE